jgi:hypothetical protein
MAWEIGEARFFAATMLARYLPSFRERRGVRKCILAALKSESYSERFTALGFRRNLRANLSSEVYACSPGANLDHLDEGYKAAFRNPDWCASYHARYITRFFALAESRGVPVFLLIAPLHPVVQAKFEREGGRRMARSFYSNGLA